MGWPYDLSLSLSDDDKLVRRQTIDFYACVAHYSAIAPVLALLLLRLVRRAAASGRDPRDGHGRYDEVPPSPLAKAHRRHPSGSLAARCRRLQWWMHDDVNLGGMYWGQRHEWILGLAWASWLLVLCVRDTGKDYLHLTKRFGAIAVSQLPIQFLLALKALNPFALAFHSSHEGVNRYHRVLGRIVHFLLLLHILFYNYFFFVAAIWLKRFFAPVVFCGVVAFMALNALATTSFARVRQFSYRLFFVVHVASAILIPVLIFFHAPSARLYLVEALVVLFLDIGVRKATTVTAPSTVEIIPGTNLVKAVPGAHIYLNVPSASRINAKSGLFDFLFNPFTVASVDDHHGTITLVARVRNGPMTLLLSQFAALSPVPPAEARRIPLAIEGPYGTMGKHFHDLLGWGAARILLVAGGVGATFALPVYRAIQQELPSTKVQLVWAIRSAGDATWAVSSGGNNGEDRSMLDDDNVHIFLTGDVDVTDGPESVPPGAGAVEMDALSRETVLAAGRNRRRPELNKIVDSTFRQGLEEPVAVLVCGPAEMAREVRRCVRPWAMRGRKVWWHSESFGW
ncbi:ferric reductase like transmembrane component domain-containing protein [Hirsutella rhossiliensis]|uniref:Ferric reductase like transmembrane component domain-containing protein n=1 Tax=Hirsutella rhossiliensis TaxID=111463 RepID=A0A9P8MR49_9HYPO|nr:ferric reductase like transmembrane component domain-containing protein [Hirsutella rhossiliensis]KAH0959715.1 ferric reductase like transmembrane component domain-containing protein [Hirsutella rhossiliensis]